jgi:hypothetical protein
MHILILVILMLAKKQRSQRQGHFLIRNRRGVQRVPLGYNKIPLGVRAIMDIGIKERRTLSAKANEALKRKDFVEGTASKLFASKGIGARKKH